MIHSSVLGDLNKELFPLKMVGYENLTENDQKTTNVQTKNLKDLQKTCRTVAQAKYEDICIVDAYVKPLEWDTPRCFRYFFLFRCVDFENTKEI